MMLRYNTTCNVVFGKVIWRS